MIFNKIYNKVVFVTMCNIALQHVLIFVNVMSVHFALNTVVTRLI